MKNTFKDGDKVFLWLIFGAGFAAAIIVYFIYLIIKAKLP